MSKVVQDVLHQQHDFQPQVTFKKDQTGACDCSTTKVHPPPENLHRKPKKIHPQFQEDFPSKGSAQIAIRTSEVSQ